MEPVLPEVDAATAINRVAAGSWLLDVREQQEWNTGHAPDAHLVPMSEIQNRLDEVPSDVEVIVICHSGGRSLSVTDYLTREGRNAVNLRGGMIAWHSAGGEIDID
ncbi:MAG: rhodanese-like domain-containing protein [Rhodoglobus sp.]